MAWALWLSFWFKMKDAASNNVLPNIILMRRDKASWSAILSSQNYVNNESWTIVCHPTCGGTILGKSLLLGHCLSLISKKRKEYLGSFSLEVFVLIASAIKTFPNFKWLSSRGISMQNMLSRWSKIWTKHAWHRYQHNVLISINPSVPVINYYMMDSQVIRYTL